MQGFAKSEANEKANEIVKKMGKIMLKSGVPLLAMAVVGGALSGRAQDINMTLNENEGYYSTASVTAPDGTYVPDANFGVFSFTVNSIDPSITTATGLSAASVPNTTSFYSVCLSPTGELNFNTAYNYTCQSFNSASPGLNPKGLWSDNGIADAAWLWNQYGGSVSMPNQGSALSLAMLELLYFGGPNGSYGAAYKNPNDSISTLAPNWGDNGSPGTGSWFYNQYLQEFADAGSSVSLPSTFGIFVPDVNNPGANGLSGQEFIFVEQSQQNGQPVPEPSTWICGALLLLPFGAITLRIIRKKSITS
jgi:hypothetical protein